MIVLPHVIGPHVIGPDVIGRKLRELIKGRKVADATQEGTRPAGSRVIGPPMSALEPTETLTDRDRHQKNQEDGQFAQEGDVVV